MKFCLGIAGFKPARQRQVIFAKKAGKIFLKFFQLFSKNVLQGGADVLYSEIAEASEEEKHEETWTLEADSSRRTKAAEYFLFRGIEKKDIARIATNKFS